MGQKNGKGSVSISDFQGRIRLRWSYLGKRYSVNLSAYTHFNVLQAKKTALQIEQDIYVDAFDMTLCRYTGKVAAPKVSNMSFVQLFEYWVTNYKQMDCEKHANYNSTRNMIKKWGRVDQSSVVKKLNSETFCSTTYNRRLTILKSFTSWLVMESFWKQNALLQVQRKKVAKTKQPKRKPFTEVEIHQILEAFQNDTFTPKSSNSKHSHYYPFMYFMFKTGVRNAEAIGLRVEHIDVDKKRIYITEVLARSLNSSSSVSRTRKETKNGKERMLPLTEDLLKVLKPVIAEKKIGDLVFNSPTGKAIDDKNFQKRVFKPILKQLNIKERVLYACRHTFGSRCIDSGLTPVMTAFLMGNNPETALRNYTHQIQLPKDLPLI